MAAKQKPVFDYVICVACGLCDQACPVSCLELSKCDVDAYKKAYPVLAAEQRCIGCAICEKACPVEAIQMADRVA